MYLHPFGILRNGYHADDFKSVKITVISIITAKLGEYISAELENIFYLTSKVGIRVVGQISK